MPFCKEVTAVVSFGSSPTDDSSGCGPQGLWWTCHAKTAAAGITQFNWLPQVGEQIGAESIKLIL